MKMKLAFGLRVLWLALFATGGGVHSSAWAQNLAAEFVGPYSIRSLGSAPEVPAPYGGMSFKNGDNNTLLIGGEANSTSAGLYGIRVQRGNDGHITGFSGVANHVADVPGMIPDGETDPVGGIDGGLAYGPGEILFYTTYVDNSIGQLKPGSTAPDKQVALNSLGYEGSTGALIFVPPGFPGAGRLKITSFQGNTWSDTTVEADGSGTYNIRPAARTIQLDRDGAEAVFYVKAGSPRFPKPSVLIGFYSSNLVRAYEIDSNGDPILSTGRDFITNLDGITGATVDPATGDFMFSSFSSPIVYVVGGFTVASASVAIKSPANNATFTVPASFWVEAEAAQPGGVIDRVEFFDGNLSLGSDRFAPYEAQADALVAGAHSYTAVAYDGNGLATTSAVVRVTVVNATLTVNLASPASTTTLPACSPLKLVAEANGGARPLRGVAFYDGATQIGNVTSPPYQFVIPHLLEGAHVFSARATDNDGLVATSGTRTVQVQPLASNTLALHRFIPGNLVFCFKGLPGSNYVLETTSALGQPWVWAPVVTNTAPEGVLILTNQMPTAPTGFYRERLQK